MLTFGGDLAPAFPAFVKLTQLCLPRTFLDRIGFNEAIRRAIRIPTDPGLVQLFQKLAPNFDWAGAQATPGIYQPPRWVGYWSSNGIRWASDGVLKLVIPETQAMDDVFRQVRECHFGDRCDVPFISESAKEPSHLLLHDSELGRLYVASFEQGEAMLVRQQRPAF